MAKYGPDAQETAYQLMMIQQKPFPEVIKIMRETYPTFSKGTLTKWRNDVMLDWAGRYEKHRSAIAAKTDKELARQVKPILGTIQELREKVFTQLVEYLEGKNIITDKNVAHVLASFVKLGDLEFKMTGGAQPSTPVSQVVKVLIMVIEKNPNIGPVFRAHKDEIIDAVFEEISET
jgi:hypothetical protein